MACLPHPIHVYKLGRLLEHSDLLHRVQPLTTPQRKHAAHLLAQIPQCVMLSLAESSQFKVMSREIVSAAMNVLIKTLAAPQRDLVMQVEG